MAKYGFIIDVDRCNGCYNCFLACKDEWIGNDHGKYGAATAEGMSLMRVNEIEYGTYDKVKVDYIAIPCQHCKNAPCIAKRPDAFYARPDGLVILDPEKSADKALLKALGAETSRLNKGIASLSERLEQEAQALAEAIEALVTRVATVEGIAEQVAPLAERMSEAESAIGNLQDYYTALEARVTALEERVTALENE